MPAISIKNINKTYTDQDGHEVQALHAINLAKYCWMDSWYTVPAEILAWYSRMPPCFPGEPYGKMWHSDWRSPEYLRKREKNG